MKIYTVHVNRKAKEPVETASFVPEGFNWQAIIFPLNFFWALTNRCWIFLVITIIYMGSSFVFQDSGHTVKMTVGAVKLAMLPFLGIWANDLLRSSLRRRGYIMDSVVSGKDASEAQRRWLETTNIESYKEPMALDKA